MSTLTRMQNKEGVAEVLPSARFKSLAATSLRSLDLKNWMKMNLKMWRLGNSSPNWL